MGGKVVELIERGTSREERIALLSVADCAVVTATRDGMNLLPYEYITCRQGPPDQDQAGAVHSPFSILHSHTPTHSLGDSRARLMREPVID